MGRLSCRPTWRVCRRFCDAKRTLLQCLSGVFAALNVLVVSDVVTDIIPVSNIVAHVVVADVVIVAVAVIMTCVIVVFNIMSDIVVGCTL